MILCKLSAMLFLHRNTKEEPGKGSSFVFLAGIVDATYVAVLRFCQR